MDKAKHISLKSYMNKDLVEVGLDEAGRGALAGPVVVAGVIMPKGFTHPLIKDSINYYNQHYILQLLIIESF